MGKLDTLYARLPVWAQHIAVSSYGVYWRWLRFGLGFERALAEYIARERFSAEEWRDWQQRRLRELLTIAATEVPYYRQTWSEIERRAACAGRLADLPLLEKDAVRRSPQAFLRATAERLKLYVFHTSGSTGMPIATYWTRAEMQRAMALREARSARWAGVSFNLPRATFSGRMVEPDAESRGPFHRFNAAERQVYLSAFHLRPETTRRYAEALAHHHVKWLTGYAVSSSLLAKFLLAEGIEVPLKAVVTTSEKLTREMRDSIARAFGCRAYEEYSTVENASFASECERGRLHVSPDAGIIEILRPDGSACLPEEEGEVVVTGLLRDHQPLIRYRLGDVAAWSAERCPCGRAMPVLKEIVGRLEDVVTGPDGRQMVRFHGVFVDQPHVFEGQIVQEARDRIRVRVVPADGFAEADAREIARRIRQRLGPQVKVEVERVDRISRSGAGKFKAVISRCDETERACDIGSIRPEN
jgi:phenylacetate-CoA ligase